MRDELFCRLTFTGIKNKRKKVRFEKNLVRPHQKHFLVPVVREHPTFVQNPSMVLLRWKRTPLALETSAFGSGSERVGAGEELI